MKSSDPVSYYSSPSTGSKFVDIIGFLRISMYSSLRMAKEIVKMKTMIEHRAPVAVRTYVLPSNVKVGRFAANISRSRILFI